MRFWWSWDMNDEYIPINTCFDVQSGFAFPSTSFVESGIPIVRMSDLKVGKLRFENAKYVSESWLHIASPFILKCGDFLLGMSGSLSNYAVVTEDDEPALLNQRVGRLKQRDKNADYEYVCYWLKSSVYARYADIQGEGAAQKNISSKQIGQFQYRDISPEKQKKISLILNSIEFAIEKTEALIHKYQQIKAGLMHDLFTRGLTTDGKLRPSREQAPELYQETSIGWIPWEWETEQLANLLAPVANNIRSGPFGSALLKAELVEEGIPFLGIDNIHVEKFVSVFRRFVSKRKFSELGKYAVRPRDVVITIMGTVGRCAVVPNYLGNALSSKHLWTMTFNQEKVVPELRCRQLNYAEWVKAWFRKQTQGGIMDAIQSKTLKTLWLPIPPQHEQKRIFNRYNAISSRIQNERDNLGKLKKQKSGLMHDLLTGKVLVTIDQAETAHV
ncbi:MAG: restriction endonuclease subunit S [Candidatus Brocadiia bacterium]|nr:MAG: restriction endonuclease subunit S [Candidatus Brocadiia bacterium]